MSVWHDVETQWKDDWPPPGTHVKTTGQPPATHHPREKSDWHLIMVVITCNYIIFSIFVSCCNPDSQFLQHSHSPNHVGLHESLLWVGYRLEAPTSWLLVVRPKRTGPASGRDSALYDSAKHHHCLSAYMMIKIWWSKYDDQNMMTKIWWSKYDDGNMNISSPLLLTSPWSS